MQLYFRSQSVRKMTSKGIIDLMEMKAYIYNDDKGDDITVTEIPI